MGSWTRVTAAHGRQNLNVFCVKKKSFKNINSSADFRSRITVQEKRVGKPSEKFSKVQLGV